MDSVAAKPSLMAMIGDLHRSRADLPREVLAEYIRDTTIRKTQPDYMRRSADSFDAFNWLTARSVRPKRGSGKFPK